MRVILVSPHSQRHMAVIARQMRSDIRRVRGPSLGTDSRRRVRDKAFHKFTPGLPSEAWPPSGMPCRTVGEAELQAPPETPNSRLGSLVCPPQETGPERVYQPRGKRLFSAGALTRTTSAASFPSQAGDSYRPNTAIAPHIVLRAPPRCVVCAPRAPRSTTALQHNGRR